MSDDLALLVSGMAHPLDAAAMAFIRMIGNEATASAKGKVRSSATTDPAKAQPSPEPLPAPPSASTN